MSFRHTRDLIEFARATTYPDLISVQSFRLPNFKLVAEILSWAALCIDPEVPIALKYDTEEERIYLIKKACYFMATKVRIRMNLKRLYRADGYAVRELLKVLNLIYDALQICLKSEDEQERKEFSLTDLDISEKVGRYRIPRKLSNEIISNAAKLFELLDKEPDLRDLREHTLYSDVEVNDVEIALLKTVEDLDNKIKGKTDEKNNIAAIAANLDTKIEKEKFELDRHEKRLITLRKVRPAFIKEFTAFEKELEELFDQYTTKIRMMKYMEKIFYDFVRESEAKEMEMEVPKIEVIPFENKVDPSDILFDENEMEEENKVRRRHERPRAGTSGRSRNDRPKAFGEMQPSKFDKDEPELINSEEESLAFEMSTLDRRAPSGRRTSSRLLAQPNSDDDF